MSNQITSLRIIYLALGTGVFLFAMVLIFVLKIQPDFTNTELEPLLLAGTLIALVCLPLSFFMFKRYIATIDESADTTVKINKYTSASIIHWALLEGPILANLALAMVSFNGFHLIIAGVLWFVYLTRFPTNQRLISELKLSEEEIAAILSK